MNKQPYETILTTGAGEYQIISLQALTQAGVGDLKRLPYSIRVLLENVLRHRDGEVFCDEHIEALASYNAKAPAQLEVPFLPGRVLLQDLTGVPALVDLAALRSAVASLGGDITRVNPLQRVDLVVDHSVQVDAYGSVDALTRNEAQEFVRNHERYSLLKWGESALANFSLVPPGAGIVHQVNLEHLASVVLVDERDGKRWWCWLAKTMGWVQAATGLPKALIYSVSRL